jgi:hypothetical protein
MSEQAIDHFREHFGTLPLIAILRGITPDEVVAVGRGLFDVGFRLIEIPMNSPEPLESRRAWPGCDHRLRHRAHGRAGRSCGRGRRPDRGLAQRRRRRHQSDRIGRARLGSRGGDAW